MRPSKRVLVSLAIGLPTLAALAIALVVARPAAAANTSSHAPGSGMVTVTQASIDGSHWSTADTRPGGASAFVPGPGPAPLGAGSVQMTTSSGAAKAQLFTYDYIGTNLSDLSSLGYSDYRSSASTNSSAQRISLNLEIYAYGTSGFTTLVYEPIYQPGGLGALHDDTWQSWGALGSGVWWSTRTVTGVTETLHGSRDGNPDYWTWDHIVAQFPNAKIVGGLGFNIGSGWTGTFSGNADALVVGVSGNTTTYNFEPDTSVCKNGGWRSYGFKNQGDCVSVIATGGKNPGN